MDHLITTTLPDDIASVDWREAPLDWLLAVQDKQLVHEMEPQALAEYVKRCALLRSSAQTRNAELRREEEEDHGVVREKKSKKPKKSSGALADEFLKTLLG